VIENEITTVGQLIVALTEYDPSSPVAATWDGTFMAIEVYRAPNGTVLIDADSGYYREKILSGKLEPK